MSGASTPCADGIVLPIRARRRPGPGRSTPWLRPFGNSPMRQRDRAVDHPGAGEHPVLHARRAWPPSTGRAPSLGEAPRASGLEQPATPFTGSRWAPRSSAVMLVRPPRSGAIIGIRSKSSPPSRSARAGASRPPRSPHPAGSMHAGEIGEGFRAARRHGPSPGVVTSGYALNNESAPGRPSSRSGPPGDCSKPDFHG